MKKVSLLIATLLIITGCTEISTDQTLPKQIMNNPYATKQILILSKLTTYKGQLIESLTKRLGKTYSFTVDDLDTIYNYNFSHYKSVVLLETPLSGKLTVLDNYFRDFAGITNFIILAVSDKPYTPSLNFTVTVIRPITANIVDTTETLVEQIRTQR